MNNPAKIYNFPITKPLTEEETRARFTKARAEWSKEWGGECPYTVSEEEKRAAMRPRYVYKPSLIDRLIPYILILGFLAVFLGVGGLMEWIIDKGVPGW